MKKIDCDPSEGYRFSDYCGRFCFYTELDRRHLLVEFLKTEIANRDKAVVLDIGCGRGICRSSELQAEVAAVAGQFWGVEPDTTVELPAARFDRTWRSLLEASEIPANSVDVAYAAMVLEHVTDAAAFLGKIHDILKPGGVFIGLTISGRSFLGFVTKTTEALGIQDRLLRMLKGDQTVDEYHYPAVYCLNTEKKWIGFVADQGFGNLSFFYSDNHDSLGYWPKSIRFIGRSIDGLKKLFRSRSLLNNMYIRLEK